MNTLVGARIVFLLVFHFSMNIKPFFFKQNLVSSDFVFHVLYLAIYMYSMKYIRIYILASDLVAI